MMDENGLSDRNWGYYEPIPTFIDRNEKPLLFSPNPTPTNGYRGSNSNVMLFPRDYTVSGSPFMSYSWLNQHRDSKFFCNLPTPSNHHSLLVPETCRTQLLQIPKLEVGEVDESLKRRQFCGGETAAPKANKERRVKEDNVSRLQRERCLKKSIEMVINGVSMDIGCLPVPVCSCTGLSQSCYRWGSGGWQSACCTTNVSMYPLPMSTKRRGARIAGRKMSQGAFRKVLEKLSVDGFDFSIPIDLKSHWAKHGTNKFVTIR